MIDRLRSGFLPQIGHVGAHPIDGQHLERKMRKMNQKECE